MLLVHLLIHDHLNFEYCMCVCVHPPLSETVHLFVSQWDSKQCTRSVVQDLVRHHDKYNDGFKKLVAENKPQRYQQASNLFSFAGFLR